MNPVTKAIAEGVTLAALEEATHEVGHGIAFTAAGIRVTRMEISRSGWFSGREPSCWIEGGPTPPALMDGYLIGLMAGTAAQFRFLREHREWSRRDCEKHANISPYDIRDYRNDAPRGAMSMAQAQARADALLARHADRLDRLTVVLARKGSLSGSAL